MDEYSKIKILLLSGILFFIVQGCRAEICGSYCDEVGQFVDVIDCGDLAWCCGVVTARYCCSDYWEQLYEASYNETMEECEDIRLEMEQDDRSSAPRNLADICSMLLAFSVILGALRFWELSHLFQEMC